MVAKKDVASVIVKEVWFDNIDANGWIVMKFYDDAWHINGIKPKQWGWEGASFVKKRIGAKKFKALEKRLVKKAEIAARKAETQEYVV